MLDGIKTITRLNNFDRFKDQIQTPFSSRINTATGELIPHYDKLDIQSYWHTAKIGELKFIVKERIHVRKKSYWLFIQGSIHKNHFEGSNFNDFTFDNVREQINHLSKLTAINAKDFRLQNLEFGVNIQTPFSPIDHLIQNLITDKGEPFNKYAPDKNGISIGYEHPLRQYTKKIYDKGLQYGLSDNLMRYELSYKKMHHLNKIGIYNLEDLAKPNIVKQLEPLLITKWNEILFQDTINPSCSIKKRDKAFLRTAANPKFWEQTKTDKTYREQRRKFKKLQTAYCTGTQDQLKEQIRDKFQYLLTH
jgi:hypothetical protein